MQSILALLLFVARGSTCGLSGKVRSTSKAHLGRTLRSKCTGWYSGLERVYMYTRQRIALFAHSQTGAHSHSHKGAKKRRLSISKGNSRKDRASTPSIERSTSSSVLQCVAEIARFPIVVATLAEHE